MVLNVKEIEITSIKGKIGIKTDNIEFLFKDENNGRYYKRTKVNAVNSTRSIKSGDSAKKSFWDNCLGFWRGVLFGDE